MIGEKTGKNQVRAVFLTAVIICSVFTGTVAFSGTVAAEEPTYDGNAVHYVTQSGDGEPVVEVPFDGDISKDSLTTENFTLLDNGNEISAINKFSLRNSTVVLKLDRVYSSDDLEVEISENITDSNGDAITNPGEKSVVFAGQTLEFEADGDGGGTDVQANTGSNFSTYLGTTIAINTSKFGTTGGDIPVTVEGEDNNYFQVGSTGTNSSVFTFDTSDRELGTYRIHVNNSDDPDNRAFVTIRDLQLEITVDDLSVTNNDTIETTVSAGASSREIKIELIDSNGDAVNTAFGTLDGQGERTFEFNTATADGGDALSTGTYTVEVSDISTGATVASSGIQVTGEITDLLGNGTATDPYILTNVFELQAIRKDTTANYELRSDINLTKTADRNNNDGFEPIESFGGTLEGNGHTITGLSISRSNEDAIGLFGSVTNSGTISNVALIDVDVSGSADVGGLAGANDGTIEGSYVSGSINGTSEVGGIAGDNRGAVEESHSTAAVSGVERVGGLVGFNNDNSTVESSYAAGPVTGDSFVGGLIGKQRIYASSVTGSYWDTQSTGQSSSAGGTGLTTAQMTGEAARENMAAFDFNETWRVSDYYPLLRPVSAESGSLDGVRVDTSSTNIAVGSTLTTSVQVEGADIGVGAIETTLTLTNSSVGAIESVTVSGSPNQTEINHTADNDSVSVKAYGLDLAGQETPTVIQVTLSADTVGTTDLRVSNTTIGSTEGADVSVRAESGATIRSVNLSPVAGFDQAPTDPDGDGKFEDINGDGDVTISDVQAIFVNIDDPVLQNNPELFDFSGNGEVNIVDVQRLFVEIT